MASRPRPEAYPAAGLLERLRALVRQASDGFRRSGRYSKMRGAIAAIWAVLALATLWIACPGSGPGNALGAEVQVLREPLVGGQQLLVRNESSDIWTDVKLTIDGGWRHEHKTVRPHDQLVLSIGQFKRGGESAPRDLKPRTLDIRCDQGRTSIDLR